MSKRFLSIVTISSILVVGNGAYADFSEDSIQLTQATTTAPNPGNSAVHGQFVSVYIDSSNNLSWSSAIPGKYTNGCTDLNGNYTEGKCNFEQDSDGKNIKDSSGYFQVSVDTSNAAKACRAIHARLPTKPEFESLIRSMEKFVAKAYTEERYGPKLTDEGIYQMQYIFKDMKERFWTSSVDPKNSDRAFNFNSYKKYRMVTYDDRNINFAVRCVVGGL